MIREGFNISNYKKGIFISILVLVLAIVFETFQQLYYINRYNLVPDITFTDVLKNQSFRWIIWLLLAYPIFLYAKEYSQRNYGFIYFLRFSLLIIALTIFNVIVISEIQMFLDREAFSPKILFTEYIPFFTFQKVPIYILGYIAIGVILHLFFSNRTLQIQVQELATLKTINKDLYSKLSSKVKDNTNVLYIKIGNKRKVIPVEEIKWIEADDYCVRIHTVQRKSYSMRSSLKSLDEKLGNSFLRVHRTAIVNMKEVTECNFSQTPYLILKDGNKVSIARSKLKAVREYLE